MTEDQHSEKEQAADVTEASCGPGCDCKTESKLSNRTRAIICLVIVLAAGAVLTRTIVRKTDTGAGGANEAFAAVPAQNQPQEKNIDSSSAGSISDNEPAIRNDAVSSGKRTAEAGKTESNVSGSVDAKESFWKEPLSSLSSLNTVAAGNDAVFVLLSEGEIEGSTSEVSRIDAAAKTITSRGINIAVFSLKKDAPEFSNLSKQLSGSGVLVMVKGRGMSGVPGSELTEERLIQAYVTASRPQSGCGPICAPSDCK